MRSRSATTSRGRSRTTTDVTAQKAHYDTVQKRLAADIPYVWLYHVDAGIIASPRVHDLTRWAFPNGAKGFGMEGVVHPWYQVWIN